MNEATYSIANLPDGITVQWSASNENLELISGQGTDTATFRSKYFGDCTINATIIANDSVTIHYNVSADFDLDEVYIDGPDFVCDNTATFTVRNLPQPSTVSFDHGPFMADSVYTVFISSYSDSPGVAKVLAEANCLGKKLRWSIFSVLTNRGSIMWKTP